MATINVKDAAGSTVALEKPLVAGQAAMAASRPVVIASDQTVFPVNLQSAGTAVAAGSGATTAATVRTVLATDSPGIIATGTPQASSASILSTQGPGTTPSRINSAATTNATNLKASAGRMFGVSVFNTAGYNVFLKFYDKASAPTVGTDTPVWTIPVQAGGGFAEEFTGAPFPFTLGIAYAITKLQPDSDTTVVVAGDLTGSVRWA